MDSNCIKRGISIYSFQEKYYRGEMSLEDCVAAASRMGVRGIEMLSDQMIPGYPSITYNLKPAFVEQWRAWMEQYRLQPVAFDVYGETKLYKNRQVTHDELFRELLELMKAAKVLGFEILRLTFHLPIEVIESLLPHAEECNMRLAVEVHAPHLLTGEWVQSNIELAQRRGSRHLGLMPDLGIFCRTVPRLVLDEALRQGATPHLVDHMAKAYRDRAITRELTDKIATMGGNDVDDWLAMRLVIGVWTYHDPRNLLTYMPYVFHVHGKFYEMTEDLVEPDVDYETILPTLIEGGYRGYIMSEYEGQRLTHGVDTGYDEVEQVRRHQEMLARHPGIGVS